MVSLNNIHSDLIHDAELDYYGRRLATCSSDKTVKIFEISEKDQSQRLVETLRGHEGPVWQAAWGHPKFGNGSGSGLLASCGYDGKVLVWREDSGGAWKLLASYTEHQASVNSVSWAPAEYGPLLACASSDGRISVIEVKSEQGATSLISVALVSAHQIGTNSVSWAPYEDKDGSRRFVSGGGDNSAKIWKWTGSTYVLDAVLEGHTDWVRDVSWSPSMLSRSYIASGSQDKQVLIWTQMPGSSKWESRPLRAEKFPDVVWRLSWSLSGNILAVSSGDNKVTLWKEGLNGSWETAGELEE